MAANWIEMIVLHAPACDSCFKTAMTSTAARQHQRRRQRDALMQEMMRVASTSASLPLKSRPPALFGASKIIVPEFKLFILERKCWSYIKVETSCLPWSAVCFSMWPSWRRPRGAAPSTQPLTSSIFQAVAGYQSWTSPWSPDDSDAPGEEVLNWTSADLKVQPLVSHLETSEGINSFCPTSFQLWSPAAPEDPIIKFSHLLHDLWSPPPELQVVFSPPSQ